MQALLARHPVLKAAATSCVMMAAGDVCRQLIQQQAGGSGGGSRRPRLDWRQTARFAAAGLCLHGPFFHQGYRWLDRLGAKHAFDKRGPLHAAMMKTAIGQVTLFPVYTCSVFSFLGLLEGLRAPAIKEKLAAALPTTLVGGTFFWPVVNVLQFMYVPATHRIFAVNVAGLMWNSFLSYMNATRGEPAAAVEHAVEHAEEDRKRRWIKVD